MRQFVLMICTAAILAGCASSRPYEEAISTQDQQLDSLRAVNRQLLQELAVVRDSLQFFDDIDSGRYYRQIGALENRINRLEFEVITSIEGGVTVETFQTDDLFESGTTNLTPGGAELLASVAQTLNTKHEGKTIRIEGHTDSVPVGGSLKEKYPSNWELAAARAASVARYFIEEQDMNEDRILVVSYGPTQPVASNATAQGRASNRRVRIAVLPDAPELEAEAGTQQASNR